MKILYHHRTLSRDGMSVHIRELIAALERRGHEVIVVGPAQADAGSLGGGGEAMAVFRRLVPGLVSELLELLYDRFAFRRLERAYLAHRPDLLYERYNLFLLAGRTLKRKYGLPFVVEVNAPLALERSEHGGLGWKGPALRAERAVWRAADAVLPVSGPLADIVAATGVATSKIHVIPNGIDRRAFQARVDGTPVRRRFGLQDKLILGFAGFMRPWHGLDRVLRFLAMHRQRDDLHFLVVGDGPARPDLQRQAKELGLAERVTFTGIVDRSAMPAHVAAFDIALQPMSVAYASPLKLFEYMALGRAILAPDQPNIREIVGDGDCALLFDPESETAFETALDALCDNAALRRRLGLNAETIVIARDFTWDGNARRIEKIAGDLSPTRSPRVGTAP